MNQLSLPAVPKPGAMISPESVAAIETEVSRALATIHDIDVLHEWRARAVALEAYLRGRDLNGPMLGATRKVEARIGQLLGEAQVGNPHGKLISHAREITSSDRNRFRILARGLDRGLPDEEWRRARDPMIALIQQRFPMPVRVPTVVMKDGKVKKPRAARIHEIETRAGQGMRAAQIATDIGMSEQKVRQIASEEKIALPDAAIGKTRRLDTVRILTETVNGVDAYVSGLSMLDGVELPDLPLVERGELMQALSRSINGLKKLRNKMEKSYAGNAASAA